MTEIGPYEHRTYPEQTYRLSVQWQQPQTKETFTYGTLIDPGFDIVRVRLISRNGVVMEERVQDGLLLF